MSSTYRGSVTQIEFSAQNQKLNFVNPPSDFGKGIFDIKERIMVS